ncbi:hypothetical protein HYDPIDRAFT_27817 [Hydnomerulius pinastri MD-312]|uniref:Uncharacterized protein n=1 Tax=Hydnomerulius pinastri MD-312 TaxID=994086 RepID=A0A0C9VHH0_9AGAM|nr:hypothetical protein HYDPIDRAFT_27817 [Hydnomerulius pinastri MD-312]
MAPITSLGFFAYTDNGPLTGTDEEPLRGRTPAQERTQLATRSSERGFSPAPTQAQHTLESIWDNKSPLTLLPRSDGGASRAADHHRAPLSSSRSPSLSPSSSLQRDVDQ